jgi:hypothetical protein
VPIPLVVFSHAFLASPSASNTRINESPSQENEIGPEIADSFEDEYLDSNNDIDDILSFDSPNNRELPTEPREQILLSQERYGSPMVTHFSIIILTCRMSTLHRCRQNCLQPIRCIPTMVVLTTS